MKYQRDANHGKILQGLIDAGFSVFDASRCGYGVSDLIVTKPGTVNVWFIEVKRPGPPSARKLNANEEAFRTVFPLNYYVVQDVEEALVAMGVRREAAA